MDTSAPSSSPRRFRLRRFAQFCLLTLLGIITAFSVGMAVFTLPGYRQKKALDALRADLQVNVVYDYMERSGSPWAPDWLIQLVGIDFVADVVGLEVVDAPPVNLGSDMWVYASGPRKTNTFNQALRPIANLTRLQRLKIESSELTDNGLLHFCNLNHLESLHLIKANVTGSGLQHFAGLRRLTIESRVPDECFLHLRSLQHLESLDLEGGAWTAAGFQNLATISTLRELKLWGAGDEALPEIARLTNLESLCLTGFKLTGEGLHHLARLGSLKHLDLSRSHRCKSGLSHLAQLGGLESLNLTGVPMSQEGLRSLSQMTGLKQLCLSSFGEIGGKDLQAISGHTHLRELSLVHMKIADEDLVHLCQMKELEVLDLSYSYGTGEGLAGLSRLPRLKTLKVTAASETAIAHLQTSLPNLQVVRVWGHP